jgi:outer membrane protein OmpA-like peptidoglycan-associated protein/opacity protein-like surface antigen
MSSQFKSHPVKSHPARVLAMLPAMFAVLCALGTLAAAQDQPTPKWEVFGGYSFFHPGADVHGTLPGGLLPLSSRLEPNPRGAGASVTYNFNRWFGLTLDGSTHWGSGETGLANRIDDVGLSTLSFGPKITFRGRRFSPFLEALVGDHRLMPEAFHHINKIGFMLGGGLDINLTRHVAWRALRADYVMSSYRYGPAATTPTTDIRGARLQTGIVFLFGGERAVMPASAACSVQPSEVFAGEPVTATASGSNFNPKRTVKYAWSGTGVNVSGSGASTQIDTTGLAPGSYQVQANLSDGSTKGVASCNASFAIKQPPQHPPTITCSANPTTVRSGDPSTITAIGQSPDNRPLTYNITVSGGRVTPNTAQTTLDTTGAPAGPITVNCTTTDDRGLRASARATVNVEVPPPPLEASKCGTIEFGRDQRRPWRVDNEAKAILDDCALRLQREEGARGVIVGNADPNEKNAANMAMQRAVNTKEYLVKEKGIDPARLEVRTGSGGTQTADIWVVPAGATFNVEGTQTFDESKGMAQPRTAPRRKAVVK